MSSLITPTNKVTVIKKKEKEAKSSSIDDLLQQLTAENVNSQEESVPIEITDQVKEKMMELMDAYNEGEKKVAQIKLIAKQVTVKQTTLLSELKTMMRLYGLKNLIRGDREFVLDEGQKKKTIPRTALKSVMAEVLGDQAKVDEIFEQANQRMGDKYVSKVKCQPYKGD